MCTVCAKNKLCKTFGFMSRTVGVNGICIRHGSHFFNAKLVVHAHVPHEFRKYLCKVPKQSGCTCREIDTIDLNYRKPHNYTTQNKVLHMAHHTLLATSTFRKTKYHFVSYGLYEDDRMFQSTIKFNNASSCNSILPSTLSWHGLHAQAKFCTVF